MTPKMILNLYAGIGGIRLPWKGDITAVEKEKKIAEIYQMRFPDDKVIVGDAIEYLEGHFHEFDAISAGPPCQSHGKMTRTHIGRRYNGWDMRCKVPDMTSLYGIINFLKHHFRGDWWLVENVKPFYDPLIEPTAEVGRHLFWSNKPIISKKIKTEAIMYKYKNDEIHYEKYIQYLCKIFKIDRELIGKIPHSWGYTHDDIGQTLRNTIHPKIALYIWKSMTNQISTEMGSLR